MSFCHITEQAKIMKTQTGTDINNIFIKLKFQKTVIPSGHLCLHQIMKYVITHMQTAQVICNTSRSVQAADAHYLPIFTYSTVAARHGRCRTTLTSLSWSCRVSTILSSSKKQPFVHMLDLPRFRERHAPDHTHI